MTIDDLCMSSHLVWLHRIVLPGPVLSLGVDVYPDVLIHVLRVVNFYQIAPWSQTLNTILNVFIDPLEDRIITTWKTKE